jgi:2-phosphosulfolactate phosphatase
MTLDVVFTPAGLTGGEVQGRVVFVVDVLRAGTTICAALQQGARAVIPVADAAEALQLAQTLGSRETVLAGERNCLRIEGFALGNSPGEMTAAAVGGKTIILTTTNGTGALLASAGANRVYIGGAVNLSVAAGRLRRAWLSSEPILIVCAGREQRFALDDAYTAGRLVESVVGRSAPDDRLTDAAIAALDLARRYGTRWERVLTASRGGRDLAALGLDRDIALAARVDAYPVLPRYADRRVTAAPDLDADPTSFMS